MAKIGIICDAYKVEMFKQELDAAGIIYTIEEQKIAGKLVVFTCISEQHIIGPITDKVTRYWIDYFKSKKN
jgi:hypothetical protein